MSSEIPQSRIDTLFRESSDAAGFARDYFAHLHEVLDRIDCDEIAQFVGVILEARDRGAGIFFIGNGGSASTASHFANDLAIGTHTGSSKPFRVISLSNNNATITAIANDEGYDQVFIQQLRTLMKPGDVVVAISASGNSPNVIKAIEYANANDVVTIGLTGFDGGQLRAMTQYGVHVPTDRGEYGPVEDAHMVLDHMVSAYLMRLIAKQADERR